MRDKYGLFFDLMDEHIAKAAGEENREEEWKNVRAFYEHFRNKFLEGVQQQRDIKRRKVNQSDSVGIIPDSEQELPLNDYTPNKQKQLQRLGSLSIKEQEEDKGQKQSESEMKHMQFEQEEEKFALD